MVGAFGAAVGVASATAAVPAEFGRGGVTEATPFVAFTAARSFSAAAMSVRLVRRGGLRECDRDEQRAVLPGTECLGHQVVGLALGRARPAHPHRW